MPPNFGPANFARLSDRGVVAVTGTDARKLLNDLVTNDLDALTQPGDAVHAALLTPQGKIMFAFFVVQTEDGFLLDTDRSKAADLVKRLTMYKLRAKADIKDLSDSLAIAVVWNDTPADNSHRHVVCRFRDPRHPDLAERLVIDARVSDDAAPSDDAGYARRRVALSVPDPGSDYALGDTFPHEANFDRLHGVSFGKGCFVGQEVVSRMQNKSVVRKRIVKIAAAGPITPGADVTVGTAVIGRVGTVAGNEALAMVRLDRAAEAEDKGQALAAGGTAIAVDAAALTAYRKSVAERPVIDL
jgi:folate-binding protein YgfZ